IAIVCPVPRAVGRLYAACRSAGPNPAGSAAAAIGRTSVRKSDRHCACRGTAWLHTARVDGAGAADDGVATANAPRASVATETPMSKAFLMSSPDRERVLDGLRERAADRVARGHLQGPETGPGRHGEREGVVPGALVGGGDCLPGLAVVERHL